MTGKTNMILIYRGTRDGSSSKVFHEKCGDNQGPTICFYKMKKGIFLVDMLLFLGLLMANILLHQKVFYLL